METIDNYQSPPVRSRSVVEEPASRQSGRECSYSVPGVHVEVVAPNATPERETVRGTQLGTGEVAVSAFKRCVHNSAVSVDGYACIIIRCTQKTIKLHIKIAVANCTHKHCTSACIRKHAHAHELAHTHAHMHTCIRMHINEGE